jgi:hypothetical protein
MVSPILANSIEVRSSLNFGTSSTSSEVSFALRFPDEVHILVVVRQVNDLLLSRRLLREQIEFAWLGVGTAQHYADVLLRPERVVEIEELPAVSPIDLISTGLQNFIARLDAFRFRVASLID